jgi:hypothetical protein
MCPIRAVAVFTVVLVSACTTPGTIQMTSPPPAGLRSAWVTTESGEKVQLHRPFTDQGDYVGWVDDVRGREIKRIPLGSIVEYRYHSDLPTLPDGANWVVPPAGGGQTPNPLGEFFAEAFVEMLFALPWSLSGG